MKTSSLNDLINFFGSQSTLARRLNIRPQAVQQWVESGRLPIRRAFQIEQITEGRIRFEDIIHLTGVENPPLRKKLSPNPLTESLPEPPKSSRREEVCCAERATRGIGRILDGVAKNEARHLSVHIPPE